MGDELQCPEGHSNPRGARFCIVCGIGLESVEAETTPAGLRKTSKSDGQYLSDEQLQAFENVRRGKSLNSRKLIAISAGLIVSALALSAAVYFLSTSPVPEVTGQTVSAARVTLNDSGFILGEETNEFSDEIGEGLVISQAPNAGSRIGNGSEVNLVLSLGPPEVTVTFVHDGLRSIAYTDTDLNCDSYLAFFRAVYPDPVLQDESRQDLATGSWVEDVSNGTYTPCKMSVSFRDVPAGALEYRVAYDADDAENNRSSWISGRDLEANGWTFSN